MEEDIAMLKHFIDQLQELSLPLHSPPSSSSSSSCIVLHNPQYQNRWTLACIEETPDGDWCDNTLMTAGNRSGIFNMLETVKRSRKEHNQEGDDNDMDKEIWQEFPQDLIENLVSKLPIATYFQFRSVCRKWNAFVNSDSFSRCYTTLPLTTVPWFYTMNYASSRAGVVYDPSMKKWHHQVIDALPKKSIVLPMASAGGLVCLVDFGHRNIYVCNPLTKSIRELPARSSTVWSHVTVGMTLNGNSTIDGYKVLWLDCEGDYEVYDSLRNEWTKRGTIPSDIKLPLFLNSKSQPVTISNTLYIMLTDPEGILSYDVVTGKWKQFIIPSPPHLGEHTLAECGDRLLLVGLLTKNAATCVCIWELQKMTLLWKEVDRMPNVLCLDFYGKHVRMDCLGNKGCLIFLSLKSSRRIPGMCNRQTNRMITYNAVTREWNKVTGCIAPNGRRKLGHACGTAFYPSPTARA